MESTRRSRIQTRRRRRRIVAVGVATVVTSGLLLATFGAGATPAVTNPGDLTVGLDLSLLTLGENHIGIRTITPATGDISGNGTFTIPASDLAFAPHALRLDVGEREPLVVVVDTLPASDVRGRLDPRTGIALVGGLVEQRWTVRGSGATCSVGPMRIGAGTGVPGARRYDEQTGAVTVVDPTPEVAAVDAATPGCADLAGLVNEELALPITTTTTTTTTVAPASSTTTIAPAPTTVDPLKLAAMPPPVPSIVLTLTFAPAPSASAVRTPSTTEASPATTLAPAPTVATRARPATPARPAAPSRPTRTPPPTIARPVQSETVRQALLRAERARTVVGIPPALSQREPGWFPSLGDIDPTEIPDAMRITPTRSAGETLRALPAGAIRSSASGPLVVVPLVALLGLGYLGFRLIRGEIARSRPRSRFVPPRSTLPPDDNA